MGRFILDGIPPSPRGIPQIEVSFDIDANGIINASAKDKASGKSQSIKIEGSVGISKEDIEKMKKEAELHAEEDKKKKELIETRNIADNLIYTSEKTLKDAGDNPALNETKKEVENKIAELRKVKDGDNTEDIKNKSSELSQAIQKVGAELYKKTQQATQQTEKEKKTEEEKQKNDKDKNTEEGEYKEK